MSLFMSMNVHAKALNLRLRNHERTATCENRREEKALSEMTKIAGLTPASRQVNLIGKIMAKPPERSVSSRFGDVENRICEATIGDETGTITLVLWNENIDKVKEGDVVSIENGFIKIFRQSMQLNIGRYGKLTESTETIEDVNTDNNLSEKTVSEPPRFRGYRDRGYRGGYRRGGRRRR